MTYKHHIIPLHAWRRRINSKATRRNKEYNAADNVVWLSLEQHIHVHQLLWELNNCEFDRIAWQGLSGTIGKEEIIHQAQKAPRYYSRKPHDEKWKHNLSESCSRFYNGSYRWEIKTPCGLKEVATSLNAYCRSHGLNQGNMCMVAKGVYSQHKGYTCKKLLTLHSG